MSNTGLVIPFGKHKGKLVQEVMALDPTYIEWLMNQPWFRENNPTLVTVIISGGSAPEETPEHNKMQVLFLDQSFCKAVVKAFPNQSFRETFEKLSSSSFDDDEYIDIFSRMLNDVKAIFEIHGWDVVVELPFTYYADRKVIAHIPVELKPSVGDDYPVVLRKLQIRPYCSHKMLVAERFDATAVTYDQVKAMFEANGIAMRTLKEIRELADN